MDNRTNIDIWLDRKEHLGLDTRETDIIGLFVLHYGMIADSIEWIKIVIITDFSIDDLGIALAEKIECRIE